jgi:sugar/nucleoside kinase (ribokinase family)
MKWERVAEDTDRLPVPGGWLYRTKQYAGAGGGYNVALCFVPAPVEPA